MILAVVTAAHASGIDVPAVGSAFSGPLARDGAAVWWNPAELARLERPTVLFGGALVGGRVAYTRNRLGDYAVADTLQLLPPDDPGALDPARSGPAETVTAHPLAPTGDLFVTAPVGPVGLGLGVYVPYAAPLSFPDDGPQRFALQRVFLAVAHVTGAVAVRIGSVSIGAGVSAVLGRAELSRIEDFAGIDRFGEALSAPPISQPNAFGADAPSTVRELDVLARPFTFTDGRSLGIDANAGLAWSGGPWDLALTGQLGSRLRFRGDFALDLNDPFFTRDLAAQGLSYDPLVTGTGELSFRLPPRVSLGVGRHLGERLAVEVVGGWVGWSVLDAFDLALTSPALAQPALGIGSTLGASLRRDWVDTLQVEASVRSRPEAGLGWTTTLGVHGSAAPSATVDVASPDGLRLVAAGGLSWATASGLTVTGDLEAQGIVPRTVRTSASDLGNGKYGLLVCAIGGHVLVPFGRAP